MYNRTMNWENYLNRFGFKDEASHGFIRHAAPPITASMFIVPVSTLAMIASPQEIQGALTRSLAAAVYPIDPYTVTFESLRSSFDWAMGSVLWKLELQRPGLQELSNSLRPFGERGLVETRQKAEAAFQAGHYSEALNGLLECESHDYQDFSLHLTIGNIYLYHQRPANLEKARASYVVAARYADPRAPRYASLAHLWASFVAYLQNDQESAIELAGKAIAISPQLLEARYSQARYAALSGQPGLAMSNLEQAIRADRAYAIRVVTNHDFTAIAPQITALLERLRGDARQQAEVVGRNLYAEIGRSLIPSSEQATALRLQGEITERWRQDTYFGFMEAAGKTVRYKVFVEGLHLGERDRLGAEATELLETMKGELTHARLPSRLATHFEAMLAACDANLHPRLTPRPSPAPMDTTPPAQGESAPAQGVMGALAPEGKEAAAEETGAIPQETPAESPAELDGAPEGAPPLPEEAAAAETSSLEANAAETAGVETTSAEPKAAEIAGAETTGDETAETAGVETAVAKAAGAETAAAETAGTEPAADEAVSGAETPAVEVPPAADESETPPEGEGPAGEVSPAAEVPQPEALPEGETPAAEILEAPVPEAEAAETEPSPAQAEETLLVDSGSAETPPQVAETAAPPEVLGVPSLAQVGAALEIARQAHDLWRTATSRNVLAGHTGDINALAFSPWADPGEQAAPELPLVLASSGSFDQSVRLWDPLSGDALATLLGHGDSINTIAFSPDGRLLASGGGVFKGEDFSIRLWDLASREAVATLSFHSQTVNQVAFDPHARRLASCAVDGHVVIWSSADYTRLATLDGHLGSVPALAFSPSGRLLATAGEDETVRLWDLDDYKQAAVLLGHAGAVAGVYFTPDGQRLISRGADQTLRLWDVNRQSLIKVLEQTGSISTLAVAPSGDRLAWVLESDPTIYLGRLDAGGNGMEASAPQNEDRPTELPGHEAPVTCLTFNWDGRLLASGDADGIVRLWNGQDGQPLAICEGHLERVIALAFSPDDSVLASGGQDHKVRVWGLALTASDAEAIAREQQERDLKLESERKAVEAEQQRQAWLASGRCEVCGAQLSLVDRLTHQTRCGKHRKS